MYHMKPSSSIEYIIIFKFSIVYEKMNDVDEKVSILVPRTVPL